MTPEKAARTAVISLVPAFKLFVPEESHGQALQLGEGSHRAASGRRYRFTREVCALVEKCVTRLRPVLSDYPLDVLTKHVTKLVLDTKDEGILIESAQKELCKRLVDLIVKKNTLGDWESLHAVRGVHTENVRFSVGKCTFYRMTDDEFHRWGRMMVGRSHQPNATTPMLPEWERNEGMLRDQSVAVANVRAADPDHADSLGKEAVEEALNLLRYGQLLAFYPPAPVPEFGLAAKWKSAFVNESSLNVRTDMFDFCSIKSIRANEGAIHHMCQMAPAWSQLDLLLQVPAADRTEMQRRIVLALAWVGQASLAIEPAVQLVALVTALETLLIRPDEALGKKQKLVERIPKLRSSRRPKVRIGPDEAARLYEMRCRSVHTGAMDVSIVDLRDAREAVAQCFSGILNDVELSACSTLVEVIDKLPVR